MYRLFCNKTRQMNVFSPLFKEDDVRKMREKDGNFLINGVRKKKDKAHLVGG